jgi:hypothetical protein
MKFKKIIITILVLFLQLFSYSASFAGKQKEVTVGIFIDTSDHRIREAIAFLQQYYVSFLNLDTIPYRHYFTEAQCNKYTIPDPVVHAISGDGCTYTMFSKATIFFAKTYPDHVHIKTLFAWTDDSSNIQPYAISNHYVHKNDNGFYFLTEMEQYKEQYSFMLNGNIEYIFPEGTPFNKQSSDSLLASLKKFEKEWGFTPIKQIRYIYTHSKTDLARMKGLDYVLSMDENSSSGYADTESNTVYCQGKGENYLHEILHLYLNPVYGKSPVNHGLVYYLGGGVAGSYQDMIRLMNNYLDKYSETDLSNYDSLISKERMLHIDHTINAMLCKLVYEKEGVKGVKRLLGYKTLEDLFIKEYKMERSKWNAFLKRKLSEESHTRN